MSLTKRIINNDRDFGHKGNKRSFLIVGKALDACSAKSAMYMYGFSYIDKSNCGFKGVSISSH